MKKLLTLLLMLLFVFSVSAVAEGDWVTGYLTFGACSEEQLTDGIRMLYKNANLDDVGDGIALEAWRVKFYDDLPSSLLALQRDDIQEMSLPRATGEYIVRQDSERYILTEESHEEFFSCSMAVLSDNAELLAALNAAISALREDGTLAALNQMYLSEGAEIPEPAVMPYTEGLPDIRVLVTGDLPPMDFMTADGQPAGYNVVLLSFVSRKLGMNIELVEADAGSRVINLVSGNVDALFWMLGTLDTQTQTYSYASDVPEGVSVTEPYCVQDDVMLILKP